MESLKKKEDIDQYQHSTRKKANKTHRFQIIEQFFVSTHQDSLQIALIDKSQRS